jgi:ABC-2 type transport system permease protein
MFLLAGLGGAWVPLEITPPAIQIIGHFTPVAWMMDGFEGILVRGASLQEVLLPATILAGFAILLIGLSVLRFKFE